MSSESKVKKLRGSGGYIMASINEDQQRKGNLGGPDLFLAPIGRLESEKISKYFCNSCEKDYEGSPKINFETPNEEVAENLILVEKGQYICNTCNSSIAEYREFKKPDNEEEVGNAKPLSSSESIPKPAPAEIPKPAPAEIPKPAPAQKQFFTPKTAPQENTQTSSTFNSLVGLAVYDEGVKQIGIVKQMGVDDAQSVVIVVTKSDGNDVNFKWSQIKKVGEIILLGSRQDGQSSSQSTLAQSTKCSSCGYENKAGSKFCENCGTKI